MKLLAALGVVLFTIPCAGAGDSMQSLRERLAKAAEPRILFIGNSYSFKVPDVLSRMAAEAGTKLVVERVTKGGWTLKRHAAAEETLAKIRGGRWDVVVLQEQSQLPSFAKEQRSRNMIPHARTLVAEVRKAGAVPVFFQTWGRRDGDLKNAKAFPEDTFEKMQARLVAGYREAAAEAGGVLVVPVGEAWAKEMKAGTGRRLFAKDGSHPSAAGVELSAAVFLRFFFGE